jgi:hypothetical protein
MDEVSNEAKKHVCLIKDQNHADMFSTKTSIVNLFFQNNTQPRILLSSFGEMMADHSSKKKMRPDEWILHHDNLLSHTALSMKQFLAKKHM